MKIFLYVFLNLNLLAFYGAGQCNLPKPANLNVTSITSCNAQLSWSPVAGASYYMLRYKKGTGAWNYVNTGTSTSWDITGLLPAKNYLFCVASFCANNATKGYSAAVKKKTASCSEPVETNVSNITLSGATISWQPLCNTSAFKIRYRVSGTTTWNFINNILATSVQLSGLTQQTTYEYQLQAKCGGATSPWTLIKTFMTLSATISNKPNILAIMVDDGRYDTYQANGAPSWFITPAITRLSDEGVNFKITCPGTSQCGPSRGTFYTGLYSHHNGCLVNGYPINDSIPLIQEILRENGYFCGFVGKYGQGFGFPQGFDWWAVSNNESYTDGHYNINGMPTIIPGHVTDIFPQLALEFLNMVPPGKPFALFYFHVAPHAPTIPRVEDEDLYLTDTMPFPSNYYSYSHDYPSFYYHSGHTWGNDSLETDSLNLLTFQSIAGVDDNVDTLTDWLESHQVLDSTLIMYTSDNGSLKGEHLMADKEIALEESIRLPMFIRYPKWFNANTVITDEIASNIDIAPTFLDLAGIPDTFGMDGVSLHKLATHEIHRKNFFYEFAGLDSVPPIRAVRSLQYKYIYSYCSDTVEEFYDLVNDPHENNNVINDAGYQNLIQTYRTKLNKLRSDYGDVEPVNISCSMKNPTGKMQVEEQAAKTAGFDFSIQPDPAATTFRIHWNDDSSLAEFGTVKVISMMGQTLVAQYLDLHSSIEYAFNCSAWPEGIYTVLIRTESGAASHKLIVSH